MNVIEVIKSFFELIRRFFLILYRRIGDKSNENGEVLRNQKDNDDDQDDVLLRDKDKELLEKKENEVCSDIEDVFQQGYSAEKSKDPLNNEYKAEKKREKERFWRFYTSRRTKEDREKRKRFQYGFSDEDNEYEIKNGYIGNVRARLINRMRILQNLRVFGFFKSVFVANFRNTGIHNINSTEQNARTTEQRTSSSKENTNKNKGTTFRGEDTQQISNLARQRFMLNNQERNSDKQHDSVISKKESLVSRYTYANSTFESDLAKRSITLTDRVGIIVLPKLDMGISMHVSVISPIVSTTLTLPSPTPVALKLTVFSYDTGRMKNDVNNSFNSSLNKNAHLDLSSAENFTVTTTTVTVIGTF